MIAGRKSGIGDEGNGKGLAVRNTNAERIVPCIQGIVRDMIEAQHALHVVDYYLWKAMYESMTFAPAASYYSIVCREAYLDEREMERDRRENW